VRPIHLIRLARNETVDTACELIREALPGTLVWVVLPWGHALGRDLVALRRLRRTSEDAAVDLRLVSTHLQTRRLAREAGLPVTLRPPLRLDGQNPGSAHERRERRRVTTYASERAARRLGRRPRHLGIGAALLAALVVFLLVGVLGAAAALFVPSATVELRPQSRREVAEFGVRAVAGYRDIDYGAAIIPARPVQVIVENRSEVPPSGTIYVADEYASCTVVFANRTNQSVTVPKGTIVRTGSGVSVRFYTVSDVSLPGQLYAHARVGAIAMEPGTTGNVKALTINVVEGQAADLVDVLNDRPAEGGSVRAVPQVHPRDLELLRSQLLAELEVQAYEQLEQELGDTEFIPPESVLVRVMSQQYDQAAYDKSETVSMSMKVVADSLALDRRAVDELATRILEAQAGEGMALLRPTLSLTWERQPDTEEGVLSLAVTAEGWVAPDIDPDRLRASLRGKPLPEALAWLSRQIPLTAPPAIALKPETWERMPWLPSRIAINVTAGGP